MCLALIAYKTHPIYDLIVVLTRDEYHDRPTSPAQFWKDASQLLAGRDERGGGTWFGVTKNSRIALLTNFRDPTSFHPDRKSRGHLTTDFLLNNHTAQNYLHRVHSEADIYNGFNLVIGEKDSLHYYSNRAGQARCLESGIYGVSNHLLNTPWPKLVTAQKALTPYFSGKVAWDYDALFNIMIDQGNFPTEQLPNTGISSEMERLLAPIFIKNPDYGTRNTTIYCRRLNGDATFIEQSYLPDGHIQSRQEFQILQP
jgi:uncharacterized protein with NRDE domain